MLKCAAVYNRCRSSIGVRFYSNEIMDTCRWCVDYYMITLSCIIQRTGAGCKIRSTEGVGGGGVCVCRRSATQWVANRNTATETVRHDRILSHVKCVSV